MLNYEFKKPLLLVTKGDFSFVFMEERVLIYLQHLIFSCSNFTM